MEEKNRFEELEQLMVEMEEYPEELEGLTKRIEYRRKRNHRRRWVHMAAGVAAVLAVFVLLVNTNQAVAKVLYEVPIVGKIAELIRLDRGISSAIENDYIQELNLKDQQGEYTLTIPYAVSDRKRVVLFFQLTAPNGEEITLAGPHTFRFYDVVTKEELQGWTSVTSYDPEMEEKAPGMFYITSNWVESDAPTEFIVKVTLKEHGRGQEDKMIPGEFQFHIQLEEPKEPAVTPLHQKVYVGGYEFEIKEIVQYPTGTELLLGYPDLSSQKQLFHSLEFSILDEQENEWRLISWQGTPQEGDPCEIRYLLEGNYFGKERMEKLRITALEVEDLSKPEVKIDLEQGSMEPEILGTRLVSVEKRNDHAILNFVLEKKNQFRFGWVYHDGFGQEYEMVERTSSTIKDSGRSEASIQTILPADGILYFKNHYINRTEFAEPIDVNLASYD